MKILWHSNAPWAATGYGNQTRLFARRIRDIGHEMSISAFYGLEGGILNWDGIKVLPRGGNPYGDDVLPRHYGLVGADIALTLIDAWVYNPDNWPVGMRWVPWFPVDSEPLPQAVARSVAQAYQRIVYSKFALKQINNAGMDAHYVPHGVDTEAFRPIPNARETLGLSKDRYIVGIVAANKGQPSRKAWPEMLTAFGEFHRRHPDALLYLHTNPTQTNGGVNLFELSEINGLKWGTDVLCGDPYQSGIIGGLNDQQMAALYSSFDVHLLASSGEGFGIPLIEAQACGCPVIVGDWTSMPELCFSGWKIPKSEGHPLLNPVGGYQFLPRPGAIVEALEAAYNMRGNQDYRSRARDGALAYDADRVTEKYWKPVLQKIAERIEGVHENGHTHRWLETGLYNPDGSMSIPCIDCGAEMRIDRAGNRRIISIQFASTFGLKFSEPDGVEWIILREIERDYKLDTVGLSAQSRVIDIGAHVGVVSMHIAKTYGCRVEAYEPNPHNYARLVANIEANGLSGLITAHNLAVTADGREVMITEAVEHGNSGSHNIYGADGVRVGSITLPEIINGERFDLLKIDCEGAEFEILTDMDMIHNHVGAVRGEFHGQHGDARKLAAQIHEAVDNFAVTMQGVA